MKEIIEAAIAGKTIQRALTVRPEDWFDFNFDSVKFDFSAYIFRVKPEPKQDLVVLIKTIGQKGSFVFNSLRDVAGANLKLTFDGETGELKSAEVIKP
jgi:hypothetical protein